MRRLQFLSRGGLLLYGLTMTFASVDWVMSLEPHWYSTIYGILFIGGQVLTRLRLRHPGRSMLVADREPFSTLRHAPSSSTTSASCCSPS